MKKLFEVRNSLTGKILGLLVMSVILLIAGCNKDDDSEPKKGFDGSVKSLEENLFNPELVDAMVDLGFVINPGDNPPNIEGTYLISTLELVSSSVEGDQKGELFNDYRATITNQNNETLTVDFSGIQFDDDGNIQEDKGSGSFISGKNNKFSLFLKLTSQIGNYHTVETARAISGVFSQKGISDIQFANFMLDNKGDIEDVYIPNNTGRIFKDGDGVSPRVD